MLNRITVHGARQHNLKNIDVEIPRNTFTVITGLERIRKVFAGVRHDLRRGPAPLCRDVLALCAAVSRSDGAAGSRFDRRAESGDFHRAEDDQPQPALDRRHRDRDLRLSAFALFVHRHPALSRLAASKSRGNRTEQILQQVLALETTSE